MKSILSIKASTFLFLAVLVVLVSFVVAECDEHVHNRHARAARAHARQIIPRAHTVTVVERVCLTFNLY
jgi:hypothetical protein